MVYAGECVSKRLNLIFNSPRRLKLRLYCRSSGIDGICAALEHNDRIHEVDLDDIRNSRSEKSC